jgi:hypothetical protein
LITTAEGESTSPNRHTVEAVENPDPNIVTGVLPEKGPLVGNKLIMWRGNVCANKHVKALSKSALNKECRLETIIQSGL